MHWDLLVLTNDKKITIHAFKVQLEVGRREGEEKASTAKKYIRYLNELSPEELHTTRMIDHFRMVMDVSKMVERENARVNALGFFSAGIKGSGKVRSRMAQVGRSWPPAMLGSAVRRTTSPNGL